MDKLISIIENYVEADEINSSSLFTKDLGMSSFDIVCLAADINKEFSAAIKPQDFIKYKTVGEMLSYIESK